MKLRVDTVYLRTAAATPAGDATMHFDVKSRGDMRLNNA